MQHLGYQEAIRVRPPILSNEEKRKRRWRRVGAVYLIALIVVCSVIIIRASSYSSAHILKEAASRLQRSKNSLSQQWEFLRGAGSVRKRRDDDATTPEDDSDTNDANDANDANATASEGSEMPTLDDVMRYPDLDIQAKWCEKQLVYLTGTQEVMMLDIKSGSETLLDDEFYKEHSSEEMSISWDCGYLMMTYSCVHKGKWYRECKYMVLRLIDKVESPLTPAAKPNPDVRMAPPPNTAGARSAAPKPEIPVPYLVYAAWAFEGNSIAFSDGSTIYYLKNFDDLKPIVIKKAPQKTTFFGTYDVIYGPSWGGAKGIFWAEFAPLLAFTMFDYAKTPEKELLWMDFENVPDGNPKRELTLMGSVYKMAGNQRPKFFCYDTNKKSTFDITYPAMSGNFGITAVVNRFGINSKKKGSSAQMYLIVTDGSHSETSYSGCISKGPKTYTCSTKATVPWGESAADVKPGTYFTSQQNWISGIIPHKKDFQAIRTVTSDDFNPFIPGGGKFTSTSSEYLAKTFSYRSNNWNPLNPKEMIAWNQDTGEAYIYASTKEDYNRNDVWMVMMTNTSYEPRCITCDMINDCLEFKAQADPKTWTYMLLDCFGPAVRHTKIINLKDFKLIKEVDRTNSQRLQYNDLQKPKIIHYYPLIRHANVTLRIKLYLPPNIRRTERVPLLLHTSDEVEEPYAGFSAYGHSHYLAVAKRWAVVEVDGRGKNLEGFTRLRLIRYRVGIVDLQDYSDAVEYVLKKHAQRIDRERLGVWGRGYGGYTAICLLGAKPVSLLNFTCGAALSPFARMYNLTHTFFHRHFPNVNHEWKTTDPLIYARADLLGRMKAIRNNALLIMHGLMDRRTNAEQTLWLTNALVEAGVAFEQMIYPDVDFSKNDHMLPVYHKLEFFFEECFSGGGRAITDESVGTTPPKGETEDPNEFFIPDPEREEHDG